MPQPERFDVDEPDEVGLEEVDPGEILSEADARRLAAAEADIAAGRLVPNARVIEWLKSWGTADELPCPRWDD